HGRGQGAVRRQVRVPRLVQRGGEAAAARAVAGRHGNEGGDTRRFVACSKAYASAISRGSLQARPVKLTPIGAVLASKPSGNAGAGEGRVCGAFGTRP